jgi:hypothetical protein
MMAKPKRSEVSVLVFSIKGFPMRNAKKIPRKRDVPEPTIGIRTKKQRKR